MLKQELRYWDACFFLPCSHTMCAFVARGADVVTTYLGVVVFLLEVPIVFYLVRFKVYMVTTQPDAGNVKSGDMQYS